jgi:hypothetical protein
MSYLTKCAWPERLKRVDSKESLGVPSHASKVHLLFKVRRYLIGIQSSGTTVGLLNAKFLITWGELGMLGYQLYPQGPLSGSYLGGTDTAGVKTTYYSDTLFLNSNGK